MSDYYVYNGHLYSASELTHFKLGWTKPGHKWITREKKNGKWIYSYKKAESNKQTKISDNSLVSAAEWDAKNVALGEELQELLKQTGRANAKPDPAKVKRIEEIRAQMKSNKLKSQMAYSRAESAKRQAVSSQKKAQESEQYQKAVKRQLAKNKISKAAKSVVTGELAARIKNVGNKEAADKAAKEAKQKYLEKKRESKPSKSLNDWYQTEHVNNQSYKRKTYKALDAFNRTKDVAKNAKNLEDLRKNKDRVKGLRIQDKAMTMTENQKTTNPNYKKSLNGEADYSYYTQNCSNCSVAWDLRNRGYDVEAKANDGNWYNTTDSISEIQYMYDGKDASLAYITDPSGLTEKEREAGLARISPNHTAIKAMEAAKATSPSVYNTWPSNFSNGYTVDNKKYIQNLEKEMVKGGNGSRGIVEVYWTQGGGHSMGYEVKNGEVILIDNQTNDRYKISDMYATTYGMGFMRTDNLEPNENIKKKVQNKNNMKQPQGVPYGS